MSSLTVRRLIGAAGALGWVASAVVVGSVVSLARTLTLLAASESTVVTVETTGATGVLLNVTAVPPSAARFLSVRPGTATG
ncbi:MAG: hypothetical protein ACI91Q_000212 [Gammaproteobacteria bacterium]|jgi:hypothetical protein